MRSLFARMCSTLCECTHNKIPVRGFVRNYSLKLSSRRLIYMKYISANTMSARRIWIIYELCANAIFGNWRISVMCPKFVLLFNVQDKWVSQHRMKSGTEESKTTNSYFMLISFVLKKCLEKALKLSLLTVIIGMSIALRPFPKKREPTSMYLTAWQQRRDSHDWRSLRLFPFQ